MKLHISSLVSHLQNSTGRHGGRPSEHDNNHILEGWALSRPDRAWGWQAALGLKILIVGFVCGSIFLGTGCLSVPEDSDIPWNAPASWEGSPYVPGFSD